MPIGTRLAFAKASAERQPCYVQRLRGWDYLPWLKTLEEMQWAPLQQVEEYRLKRLKALLDHCNSNVPFFRDEFRKLGLTPADIKSQADLKKLPKTDKTMFREDYSRFFAVGHAGKIYKWVSSGSSGQPFPFHRSKEAVARNTFAPWSRARRWPRAW